MYNDSYELINEAEVNIDILNSENKKFTYNFSKTSKSYKLDAGLLPVGTYKYQAQTKVGNKQYIDNGQFIISPLTIEASNTVADHKLMNKLATEHDGKMFFANQFDKLLEALNKRDDVKYV